MRLFFDNQIFLSQNFGGISRYFTEIISGLKQYGNVEIEYNLWHCENAHFKESKLPFTSYGNFLPSFNFKGKGRVKKLLHHQNEYQQKVKLQKRNYDLFVPTYYDPYFLDFIGDTPYVLTVYDMIHELFPMYFANDQETLVQTKKLLIKKATKIIAISESTKSDIVRLNPEVDKSKIEVVHLSHSIKEGIDKVLPLPKKYILFVGNRRIYKNFKFFLETVTPLLRREKELHLVCTGPTFTDDELWCFREQGVEKQLFHFKATDEELKNLYRDAQVFVFPSEYEGFGIPILEAMASGCPVIASATSSFPEVAGEAALYFNLGDQAGLAEALEKVIFNPEIKNQLREKGYEQVKKFSWDKTAKGCYEVFKSAVS